MNIPFALPPWLPWWVPIIVLVPALLYALMFLLMPFSVFGVKARLDVIEARLDEIQGEIRLLVLRIPEYREASAYQQAGTTVDAPPTTILARPPIVAPPFARETTRTSDEYVDDGEPPPAPSSPIPSSGRSRLSGRTQLRQEEGPRASRREEPRLDWPR